jgi:hypothetical protein
MPLRLSSLVFWRVCTSAAFRCPSAVTSNSAAVTRSRLKLPDNCNVISGIRPYQRTGGFNVPTYLMEPFLQRAAKNGQKKNPQASRINAQHDLTSHTESVTYIPLHVIISRTKIFGVYACNPQHIKNKHSPSCRPVCSAGRIF